MVPMLYVILVIAALCLAGVLAMVYRHDRAARESAATRDSWTVSRQACDEDLQRVTSDVDAFAVGGNFSDVDTMRADLKRAEALLASAAVPDDLPEVTRLLARVRTKLSRMAGGGDGALPDRPLCFFNPHHGISQTRAAWTNPAGVGVHVPCCAADARRLSEGADAYVRTMKVGSERTAWWLVPDCRPWAQGWFADWANQPVMAQLTQAAPMLAPEEPSEHHRSQRRAG